MSPFQFYINALDFENVPGIQILLRVTAYQPFSPVAQYSEGLTIVRHSMAKILIVDDEERNRRLLDVFAKADGYETVAAANGETALRLALSECPDLILLDLMMPGMDGFEVTRWLKANPLTNPIPIIIVTALEDVASHKRMLTSGAEEFINKPVDRWELSMRIAKHLQPRQSSAGPPAVRDEAPNG